MVYQPKDPLGFTLIELLIAIAISVVISAAIYFSLSSALESWGYSRDHLALQKVISEVMDEVADGTFRAYGLKDSLEILSASGTKIEFVPPWTDDTHMFISGDLIYTLNRRPKPGSAVPVGEVKFPGSDEYRTIPVTLVETEFIKEPQVKIGLVPPEGSQLRFTYHPDPKTNPDTIKTIWWDPEEQQLYSEDIDGIENISRNPLGVKLTDFRLRYYDNANNPVGDQGGLDQNTLLTVTGIEVWMKAELGQYSQELVSFVNLRNSPMRKGFLTLREGTKFPIPDSHNIHTLLLTNFSGVGNLDELQLEATPSTGKSWGVTIKFSKTGSAKAIIETLIIEYPPGHSIYTEHPRSSVELGLDLLTLGANGLYDYDDDPDIEDFVLLKDEVVLEVKRMDIEGAGLFVRP